MGYRFGTTQTAAVSTTFAVISNSMGSQTYMVRVVADVACHYAIGKSSATTSDPFLPANWIEDVHLGPGQAVTTVSHGTSTGTFYVTELN